MRERLEEHLRSAVRCLLDEAGDMGEIPAFGLESSRLREHGDFACNAAMILPSACAGRRGRSPGGWSKAWVTPADWWPAPRSPVPAS